MMNAAVRARRIIALALVAAAGLSSAGCSWPESASGRAEATIREAAQALPDVASAEIDGKNIEGSESVEGTITLRDGASETTLGDVMIAMQDPIARLPQGFPVTLVVEQPSLGISALFIAEGGERHPDDEVARYASLLVEHAPATVDANRQIVLRSLPEEDLAPAVDELSALPFPAWAVDAVSGRSVDGSELVLGRTTSAEHADALRALQAGQRAAGRPGAATIRLTAKENDLELARLVLHAPEFDGLTPAADPGPVIEGTWAEAACRAAIDAAAGTEAAAVLECDAARVGDAYGVPFYANGTWR